MRKSRLNGCTSYSKYLLFILCFVVAAAYGATQRFDGNYNITGAYSAGFKGEAAASALLDLRSFTKGVLLPRMSTTQRDAIVSPSTSLAIYNTTNNQFEFWNGSSWQALGGSASAVLGPGSSTNNDIALFNGTTGLLIKDSGISVSGTTISASITGNAATATQFALAPSGCGANTYATGIAANGNLTCSSVSSGGFSGTLPITSGGTGQTTKAAAFDALSPCTSNGIITYGSSTNSCVTTGVGNIGLPLVSNGSSSAPSWTALTVAGGGTGLTSGTSGGILGFTASGTLASSGALTQNALLLGGGAGATPGVMGSLGTTTTLLHGNASGAPTFGAVSLTADVSNVLPIANGGTNNGSLGVTAGGTLYTDGSKIVNVGAGTTGQVLKSNGASAPTWGSVVSGGAKNYLTQVTTRAGTNTGNGDFELGTTTGWSLAHSALTSNFPSTVGTAGNSFSSAGGTHGGSAASANLSISATNSLPIGGTYSGLLTQTTTSTTAGDMLISDAFWIDTEDQAKVLRFSYYYQVSAVPSGNFSGTSSNTFGNAIYDVTNGAWIQPAGVWCQTQSSGMGLCTGTFQTTSSSTQYQLAIFINQSTAAVTQIYFDDIFVGPQHAPIGPVLTDYVTCTVTGSWSANTTYSCLKRQVGDSNEYDIKVATSGAPTSATLTVNLPSGDVIDTSKFTTSTLDRNSGYGEVTDSGVSLYDVMIDYSSTTAVIPVLKGAAGTFATAGSAINATSPMTFGAGDYVHLHFTVPIVGKSSNVQMSSDTDTRVVAMTALQQTPTGTLTSSYNVTKFGTVSSDSTGSYSTSTGLYTCPVTGKYVVDSTVEVTATYTSTQVTSIKIFKNGTSGTSVAIGSYDAVSSVTTAQGIHVSGQVDCNAGETLGVYAVTTASTPSYTASVTGSALSIFRLSGPATIAATETVAFTAYRSTNQTGINPNGSFVKVAFDAVSNDTHGAFSTANNRFVAPVSGRYVFQAAIDTLATNVLASQYGLVFYKNGASVYQGAFVTQAAGTNIGVNSASPPIQLNAGDYVEVFFYGGGNNSASTITAISGPSVTWFGGYRVGN